MHFTALWPRASPSAAGRVGNGARALPSSTVPYPAGRVGFARKPWPAPTRRPVRRPSQGGPRVFAPTPDTLGTRCPRACILSRTDPDASLNRFRTRVPGRRHARPDSVSRRILFPGSLFTGVVVRRRSRFVVPRDDRQRLGTAGFTCCRWSSSIFCVSLISFFSRYDGTVIGRRGFNVFFWSFWTFWPAMLATSCY